MPEIDFHSQKWHPVFIRLDEGGQLNPEQIYFSDCAEMSIILGFSPFPLNHDIAVINSRVEI